VTPASDNDSSFSLEISDQAPNDWDDLLSRDPAAEYTHTRYWTDAVCSHLPGAGALWLTLRKSGELVGGLSAIRRSVLRKVMGLPLGFTRLVSSYEGTSGGPVVAVDLAAPLQDRIFGDLVEGLAEQRSGPLGSCALVLSPVQEEKFGPLMGRLQGWQRQEVPTALVSLADGIDQVDQERLVMNKRNERNRGLRRGAEVFATDDAQLLAQYYRIYDRAAGHWGIEPVPVELLQALLRDEKGRVFFTCVRLEGQVIGGHLNLHYGDKVLAWNGVTDPRFARTHFPATLCFWGDMVEACRRQAGWLDLGGSGSVGSLSGFKKYFGAELRVRGLYTRDSWGAQLVKKGRQVWRNRRAGSGAQRWHDGITGNASGNRNGADS
jgi:hypothetical protein